MKYIIKLTFFLILCIPLNLFSNGLRQDTFKERREALMNNMGNSIAVFIAPKVSNRNSDIDYKFRQNSDIYYLTGFEEPEFAFVLAPGEKHEYIMFVKPNSTFEKIWHGGVTGISAAMEKFGADTAYAYDEFYEKLSRYVRYKEKLYYDLDNEELNAELLPILNNWNAPKTVVDPSDMLAKMRSVKDEEEIKLIRKSVGITCNAMEKAAKRIKPGLNEREIEALIEYNFKVSGSERIAFPCIIGAGENSLALHYSKNNSVMKDGDLILMDIGGEYNYYASDITRTLPVNGKFTKEQKDIYNVVLDAQNEIIKIIKPGINGRSLGNKSREVINKGLFKLGLLTDLEKPWQEFVWFAHGISHPVGIDVHDSFYYDPENPWQLKEGMVLAIEPGVYISESYLESLKKKFEMYGMPVPDDELNEFIETIGMQVKKYDGIGIRIEDDVLVTSNGHEVLSKGLAKTVQEIEKLME